MRYTPELKNSFQKELKLLIFVLFNITIFCHYSFSDKIQTGSKSGGGHTGNVGSNSFSSFNNNFSNFNNSSSNSLFGNSDNYYPVLRYMFGKKRDTCSSGPITGAIEYNRKKMSVKVNGHPKENIEDTVSKINSCMYRIDKSDNQKVQYKLSIPPDAEIYKEYVKNEDSLSYLKNLKKNYIFTPRWGKKVFWGYDIKIVGMFASKLSGIGCATDLDMNFRLLKNLGVRLSAGYLRCKSNFLDSYYFWKKNENSVVNDTGFLSEKFYTSQTFLTFNVWTSNPAVSIGEIYCSVGGGCCYSEETLQGYSMEFTGISDESYLLCTSQKQDLWKPLLSTGCGFNSPMRSNVICLGFEMRYFIQINPNKKELPIISDNTPFIHFLTAGLKIIF